MTEAFLQYVWQHQLLEGELVTTEGLPVVVERPGMPNHDAGPDFFNARVRIGDMEWAGNVEVHVRTSDWKLHRHSADAAYNNVVVIGTTGKNTTFVYGIEVRLAKAEEEPEESAPDAGEQKEAESAEEGAGPENEPAAEEANDEYEDYEDYEDYEEGGEGNEEDSGGA